MIKNQEIIDRTINKLEVNSKRDLIKSALNKEINERALEKDFLAKSESSKLRFEKARVKFEDEKRIFESSQRINAESTLEKTIKVISTKLEALGF